MDIRIVTRYLTKAHVPHATDKDILAGQYHSVYVYLGDNVMRMYGNYTDRGEEKAAAFADGFKAACIDPDSVQIVYSSAII